MFHNLSDDSSGSPTPRSPDLELPDLFNHDMNHVALPIEDSEEYLYETALMEREEQEYIKHYREDNVYRRYHSIQYGYNFNTRSRLLFPRLEDETVDDLLDQGTHENLSLLHRIEEKRNDMRYQKQSMSRRLIKPTEAKKRMKPSPIVLTDEDKKRLKNLSSFWKRVLPTLPTYEPHFTGTFLNKQVIGNITMHELKKRSDNGEDLSQFLKDVESNNDQSLSVQTEPIPSVHSSSILPEPFFHTHYSD